MDDLRLALMQCGFQVSKKRKNLNKIILWVKEAKKNNADIVCFPELSITGHIGHFKMINQSEPVPEGDCCQELISVAKRLNIYIVAGISEIEKGIYYNTQFIVGPNGYIGKQRKIHLSRDEHYFFRHGTKIKVFLIKNTKVGIIICYDNSIPEVSRCLAIDGAELLLCPHSARYPGKWDNTIKGRQNIAERQKKIWRKIQIARAYDNGCYIGLCNAADRNLIRNQEEYETLTKKTVAKVEAIHGGGCMVIDPYGEIIKESKSKDISDEMVICDLYSDKVEKRRLENCFNLRTRRIESFFSITRLTE